MKQLVLLSIIAIMIMACNKSRPSYLMPRDEKELNDNKLPANYKGPFGTDIGNSTLNEFYDVLKKHGFTKHIKSEYAYRIPDSIFNIDNIGSKYIDQSENLKLMNFYILEPRTYLSAISINDTVVHLTLSSENLIEKIKTKYGDGIGEYKDFVFGRNAKGDINFNDYLPREEYRYWQNKNLIIKYKYDDYEKLPYPLRAEISDHHDIVDMEKVEIISIKHYKRIKTLIDNHIATEREKIKQADIIKDL